MPDALSKTIPIWCAVLNRLLFGEGEVHVPEHLVGESERAQMNARIEGWVEEARVWRLFLLLPIHLEMYTLSLLSSGFSLKGTRP